jgi:CheY-like chemotaxis protein
MPLMDGFETDLIRQIDKLKHVPIIFLTAIMIIRYKFLKDMKQVL